MTRPKQKYVERQYFDIFAKAYQLPEGRIESFEKPDFIINGTERIGIEITNLYIKHGHDAYSEQQQNFLRNLTLEHARSAYFNKHTKNYEYWFSFDPEIPVLKPKHVSKKILQLIEESLKTNKVYNLTNKKICPEVNYFFCNKSEYKDASWRLCQVHNVPNLNPKMITEVINQKNAKAQNYASCDKYWLLIIVEFWDPAQDQTMYLDENIFFENNVFEKIIIYKPATGEIIER